MNLFFTRQKLIEDAPKKHRFRSLPIFWMILAMVWGLAGQTQTVYTWVTNTPGVYSWTDLNNWDDGNTWPAANFPGGVNASIDIAVFNVGVDITVTDVPSSDTSLSIIKSLSGLYFFSGTTMLKFDGGPDGLLVGAIIPSPQPLATGTNSFEISPGAKVIIQGSNPGRIILSDAPIGDTILGEIFGTLQLDGHPATIDSVAHEFRVNDDPEIHPFLLDEVATRILVKNGGKIILGSDTSDGRLSGYPFGGIKSNSHILDAATNLQLSFVRFEAGSTLEYYDGEDPYGPFLISTLNVDYKLQAISMEPGSTFDYKSTRTEVFPAIYGNKFANFTFSSNIDRDVVFKDFRGKAPTLGGFSIDTLTITNPKILRFDHIGLVEASILGNIKLPSTSYSQKYLKFEPQDGAPRGIFTLNLAGKTPQTITGESSIFLNGRCQLKIVDSAVVNLDAFINIEAKTGSGFGNVRVEPGSRLNILGDRYIHGSGDFSLSPGGTLGIGSPQGITASSDSGNVRNTGLRGFAPIPAASYAYIGSSDQVTGTGLPVPSLIIGLSLIIDKDAAGQTVRLTNAYRTANLQVLRGNLDLNGKNLFLRERSKFLNFQFGVNANGSVTTSVNDTVYFEGRGSLNTLNPISFNNVEITARDSFGVDFGSIAPTIINQLVIRSGTVTNPPLYGDTSTLKYLMNSNYTVGSEWLPNFFNSPDRGVPNHVVLESVLGNRTIRFANSTGVRQCLGNFSVVRTTGSGTLNFTLGSGSELRVKGNWSRSANTLFTHDSRPVTFNGSGVQEISVAAGRETFHILRIDKPAGSLKIGATTDTINITSGADTALYFKKGELDLNGKILRMLTSGGGIRVDTAQRRIFNSSGTSAQFNIDSVKAVTQNSGGSLLFADSIIVNLNNRFNFGAGNLTTINGQLNINRNSNHTNSPFYGPNSTLAYNVSRTVTSTSPGTTEWRPNLSSGAGVPRHVFIGKDSINAPVILNPGTAGQFFQCNGNMTIGGNGGRTLTLGTNLSELRVGGNWNKMTNGVFTPSTKTVVFNGPAINDTITAGAGLETFYALAINKVYGGSNVRLFAADVNIDTVLNLAKGNLDLNGKILTLAAGSGNVQTRDSIRNIFTSTGNATVVVNGAKTVTNVSSGTLVFGPNTTVELNSTMNFGSAISTVNGTLQLNASGSVLTNPPTYGSSSTLLYNKAVSAGTEWAPTITSGPGVPQHVQVGKSGVNGSALTFSSALIYRANGNVTIGDTGAGTGYSFNLSSATELGVGGNWRRYSNGTFLSNNKITRFLGVSSTSIEGPGAGEIFEKLIFEKNNIANTVTFSSKVTVSDSLGLLRGRVITDSTNILEVTNTIPNRITGVVPSGINGSYIDGPMRRSTVAISGATDKYAFPLGHFNGIHHYQPIWLRDVTLPATFTAQYHRGTPPQLPGFLADFIKGIMANNYWSMQRNSGTGNATMVLNYQTPPYTWVDLHGGGNSPSSTDNVGVVWLDGYNNWRFPGSGSGFIDENGDLVEPEARHHSNNGLIRSREITDYSTQFFTMGFAFNKVLEQPLPVTLLAFAATLQNRDAVLNWKIDSQVDLQSFEVEYSTNGQRFARLATIKPGGTEYGYRHNSLPEGLHYYRLVIYDKDGSRKYSKIELVQVGTNRTVIFGLVQNPVRGSEALIKVNSATNQKATVVVVDISGRVILTQKVSLNSGANQPGVSVAPLTRGLYRLVFRTDDGLEKTMPMMIQ